MRGGIGILKTSQKLGAGWYNYLSDFYNSVLSVYHQPSCGRSRLFGSLVRSFGLSCARYHFLLNPFRVLDLEISFSD